MAHAVTKLLTGLHHHQNVFWRKTLFSIKGVELKAFDDRFSLKRSDKRSGSTAMVYSNDFALFYMFCYNLKNYIIRLAFFGN
jgi:hypothetical protein